MSLLLYISTLAALGNAHCFVNQSHKQWHLCVSLLGTSPSTSPLLQNHHRNLNILQTAIFSRSGGNFHLGNWSSSPFHSKISKQYKKSFRNCDVWHTGCTARKARTRMGWIFREVSCPYGLLGSGDQWKLLVRFRNEPNLAEQSCLSGGGRHDLIGILYLLISNNQVPKPYYLSSIFFSWYWPFWLRYR